ncbi:hypothetical protein GCM10010435_83890 [Winogradskya consettensis]|uniref:Uncharacterized protein n=1 Tax=Winogradskya consettensis TaxID=113560 RepID=A0A919SZG7_9ACTN|nr:hypothetical protein [Actinoplanes consettensis]GIM82164.1 hypothetical protein Aco04nite_80210 [Actinoplanes consettensis]
MVLGVGNEMVAIVAGIRAMRTHGYPSVAPDPTMLSDHAVLWCLGASLACFPLWALIGTAIGQLVRRGALLTAVVTIVFQPATFILTVGLAAPPSSHPLAVAVIADAGPAAMLMPAILLGWATVATATAILVNRHRINRGRRSTA